MGQPLVPRPKRFLLTLSELTKTGVPGMSIHSIFVLGYFYVTSPDGIDENILLCSI